MAKIKKVELNISPGLSGGGLFTYRVTVKVKLGFLQSEEGQKFNYRINLYDDKDGPFQPDLSHPTPIYKFKFGSGYARHITVDFPMQSTFPENRFVSSETLDVTKNLLGQSPQPDNIRAGVLLYSGGAVAGQAGILVDAKISNLKVITAEQFG